MKRCSTLAALLLAAPLAMADPNPGGDNPGSTTITENFFFAANVPAGDACFDTADWCAEQLLEFELDAATRGRGKHRKAASASIYLAVACEAAARARSGSRAWFFGGGELNLTRHGNHGAMHHIELDAGMASGALAFAGAGAAASASAEGAAMVFAGAAAIEEVCSDVEILDEPVLEFCADAYAVAVSEATAYAEANAFAASSAMAGTESVAGILTQTAVYAANIEEFHSVVAAGAMSFAAAEAEAFAAAMAAVYVEAYAEAYAEACNSIDPVDAEIEEMCSAGWAAASAYAEGLAVAYSEAQASALSGAGVRAYLPVTYINENGIYDTISFGPDADWFANAAAEVSCTVPEEPEGD